MGIIPPRQAFERPLQTSTKRLAVGGYSLDNFQKVTTGKGGEMLSYYLGHSVPRKGLPYIEAIDANNEVKRLALSMLIPFSGVKKGLMGLIENWLNNFNRLAEYRYSECERVPYLKREHYNTTSKAVWTLMTTFLEDIGISNTLSNNLGKIFATMLEYDEVYRLPIVDVMSEFTQEEIIKSPVKFVNKFLRILNERSVENKELVAKFSGFLKYLKYGLLIPKIRRAFKKAFVSIDFSQLQYDEIDLYWTNAKADYNFRGLPIDERIKIHYDEVLKHWEKNKDKKYQLKEIGKGVFTLLEEYDEKATV